MVYCQNTSKWSNVSSEGPSSIVRDFEHLIILQRLILHFSLTIDEVPSLETLDFSYEHFGSTPTL